MENNNGLSPDLYQLAAALQRVEFEEGDVLNSIREAKADGSAQVGYFPQQGEAQFTLHPVLSYKDNQPSLVVVAFNGNVEPGARDRVPEFTVALHTTAGETLLSVLEGEDQVIDLPNPGMLIGARLELVK